RRPPEHRTTSQRRRRARNQLAGTDPGRRRRGAGADLDLGPRPRPGLRRWHHRRYPVVAVGGVPGNRAGCAGGAVKPVPEPVSVAAELVLADFMDINAEPGNSSGSGAERMSENGAGNTPDGRHEPPGYPPTPAGHISEIP